MKITIYTITDCQFSAQEKEYLKNRNLPFEEKNLETNRDFLTEMLAVSNNFAGTPVTKIEKDDGQIIVLKGFTKEEFDAAIGPEPSSLSTNQASAQSNNMMDSKNQLIPDTTQTTPPSAPPTTQTAAQSTDQAINAQNRAPDLPPAPQTTTPAGNIDINSALNQLGQESSNNNQPPPPTPQQPQQTQAPIPTTSVQHESPPSSQASNAATPNDVDLDRIISSLEQKTAPPQEQPQTNSNPTPTPPDTLPKSNNL